MQVRLQETRQRELQWMGPQGKRGNKIGKHLYWKLCAAARYSSIASPLSVSPNPETLDTSMIRGEGRWSRHITSTGLAQVHLSPLFVILIGYLVLS